jgi:hypothetical protein
MADGLGNAVGGLLGLAILANVAGNIAGGRRTTTTTRTVYKNKPKGKIKKPKIVTVVRKTRTRPTSFFG